jgi:hypothetical protein
MIGGVAYRLKLSGRTCRPWGKGTTRLLGCVRPQASAGEKHDPSTAASHRQVDQWHVAVSTGHQGPEIKPDGMLAGATPGRQPHSHVGGIAVSARASIQAPIPNVG